jgi:hypothetical protein
MTTLLCLNTRRVSVLATGMATCKSLNFCSVSLTRYCKHSKRRRTMQGPTSALPARAFEVLKRVASNESQNHRFKSQVQMLSFAFLKRNASALPQRLRPREPDGLGSHLKGHCPKVAHFGKVFCFSQFARF